MASGYGRKKTLKDHKDNAVRAFKKAVAVTLAAGAFIGAPGYYFYGTVEETDIKVKTVDQEYVKWDDSADKPVYKYTVTTDKGVVFKNEDAYPHMKFDSKELQSQFEEGKSYRIEHYGVRFDVPVFGDLHPNIISAREISKGEAEELKKLKAAEEAKKKAQEAQGAQAGTGAQPAAGATQITQTFGALSGRVMTYDVVTPDGKYSVQVTAPVEVAGKLQVSSVTPLQPVPPVPSAPKP